VPPPTAALASGFRTQYDRRDSRLRVIDDSFGIVIRHLFTPLSSRDHPRKKQNSDGENRMGTFRPIRSAVGVKSARHSFAKMLIKQRNWNAN
jgi:hypothetical protein